MVLPFLVGSCTVGPNYRTPTAPLPAQWTKTTIGPSGKEADLATWWRGFKDPVLDTLVRRAIGGNLDLQLAQARIREARADRIAAGSGLWPTLSGSASATRFHGRPSPLAAGNGANAAGGATSQAGATNGAVITRNLFQVGLDSSWEIDIFGGTRRSVEAAAATLGAAVEDERATLVSLLGELATDYIDLRSAQSRLKVAEDALQSEEDTLKLTEGRFKAGLGSALDVAQAQAAVATMRSTIPGLQTAARDAIHELSVLIGTPPERLVRELNTAQPVPIMQASAALKLPADLLRRRPDIRAAERRVAAANADIGVAIANEYPAFTLAGNIGINATRVADLGDVTARTWSFGPSITLPIFNAGKLAAEADARRAQWEQAVITYRSTVLAAAQEVEDAITAYENERVHRATLSQSAAAYGDALSLSRDLYSRGLTSFLSVLDAERSLYNAQDQLAQSNAALSIDMVRLFKALGGGWTEPKTVSRIHRS